jgi:septum formation inhibitor MinC
MDSPFNDDEGFLNPAGIGPAPLTGSSTQGGRSGSEFHAPAGQQEGDERGNVIAARGTAEGLVLRIDGRVEPNDLRTAVRDFLESRRSFLSGHDIAFEWVGRKPEEPLIQELTTLLSNEFAVSVRSSKLKPAVVKTPEAAGAAEVAPPAQPSGLSVVGGGSRPAPQRFPAASVEKPVSLFDGIEGFDAKSSAGNAMLWDEPDARIIYGTLRSGQKVETEHSIVVFGDVNSGAEVIAGGDIVILGTLRGIAHAGAYDETGGGRVIFGLNLQPTQLRIGLVISRGAGGDRGESFRGAGPEVARVESNMIVVEPYQSRTVWVRRRE